jgi:DNA (cytosine-5)-methyltransferase 1
MTLDAIDLFCGAGGLTRGLLDAGVNVLGGYDADEACRRSYEYNNPNSTFFAKDIRAVTGRDLRRLAKRKSFTDFLLAGCAPCQPFSQQLKNGECRSDGTLLGEFGRLVEDILPGCVMMENVPGIARVKGNSTFRRFLNTLRSNGYDFVYGVVDAKKYGVPQTRRRLVLLASRHGKPCLPPAKSGTEKTPLKTVRVAISHFPTIKAGERHPTVPNHVASVISPLNIERLRHTPHDGGDRRSWPKRLILECHAGSYEGHTDVYGRMAWDEPAPTLTARCHSISNGRYGHPVQDRAISLREAAALQSFPDGYEFFGSNKHIAQQIGNAVPVRLAEALGLHLLSLSRG